MIGHLVCCACLDLSVYGPWVLLGTTMWSRTCHQEGCEFPHVCWVRAAWPESEWREAENQGRSSPHPPTPETTCRHLPKKCDVQKDPPSWVESSARTLGSCAGLWLTRYMSDSFSTKRNLQRKLKPSLTWPMTDRGTANSALLIGFHNWVTLGLSLRCN